MYEWDLPEYRRNYGEPLHEEWWQYQEIRLSPMTSRLPRLASRGPVSSNQILSLQNIATPDHRCTPPSSVFSCFFLFSISSLTGTTGYLGNVNANLVLILFLTKNKCLQIDSAEDGGSVTEGWTSLYFRVAGLNRPLDFYVFIDRINTHCILPGNKGK